MLPQSHNEVYIEFLVINVGLYVAVLCTSFISIILESWVSQVNCFNASSERQSFFITCTTFEIWNKKTIGMFAS